MIAIAFHELELVPEHNRHLAHCVFSPASLLAGHETSAIVMSSVSQSYIYIGSGLFFGLTRQYLKPFL